MPKHKRAKLTGRGPRDKTAVVAAKDQAGRAPRDRADGQRDATGASWTRRLHSALGCKSPVSYERNHAALRRTGDPRRRSFSSA